MPKSQSKYKFKPGHTYQAKYSFGSNNVTIELEGNKIVRHGLKAVIRHHANRLQLPEGYSCVVED